jgi:polyhydroxyalkanoate synthase
MNIDELESMPGNISGAWLSQFFVSLRPFELIGKKYLRFIRNLDNQEFTNKFLRVEKWLNDAPDQTNTSFVELVRDFYQGNKLIKGEIKINGRKVDLTRLEIPVLNVMASEDEIVPVSSSRCLREYVQPENYTQKIFPSGHIGIYISDKVGRRMPRAICNWLKRQDKNSNPNDDLTK